MDGPALFLFVFISVLSAISSAPKHEPQVYEEVDETPLPNFSYRSPKAQVIISKPVFNFSSNAQRDQLKWRYLQQQKSDLSNIIRKKPLAKLISALRAMKYGEIFQRNKQKNTNEERKTEKHLRRFSRTIRNENKVEQMLQSLSSSNLTKNSTSSEKLTLNEQEQIKILNTLLSKNPSDQLEGLKELLQTHTNIFPLFTTSKTKKRYAPVTDNTIDVPVPHVNPVYVMTYSPGTSGHNTPQSDQEPITEEHLNQLQSQLDVYARSLATEQLQKAQEEALQRVRAQHAAIAVAQQEAAQKMRLIQEQVGIHHQHIANPTSVVKIQHYPHDKGENKPSGAQEVPIPSPGNTQSYSNRHNDGNHQQERPGHTQFLPVAHPLQINEAYLSSVGQNEENENEEDTQSDPQSDAQSDLREFEDPNDYATNYAFGYQVQDYDSENNFGHEEASNGDDIKGHYHVQLPDGRVQHVEYTADSSGFHAKVTYSHKS